MTAIAAAEKNVKMDYKKIGGREIPVLGIGTWGVGGYFEADKPDPLIRQQQIESIRHAIELGMTHIDTSEIYGGGKTEEIVGEAIKPFKREQLFITGKIWSDHLHYDDVIKSARKSLERLKTGYLDLYLIHWPNPNVPISETMKAFEKLHNDGLIRNVGVSNFSKRQVIEAQSHLKKAEIKAVQNEYNLLHKDNDVLELCEKQKMLLIAYRPLAKGRLAKPGIALLDTLAQKYGKTQAQIAINWLLAKKPVIAIPKATTKEHMIENLGALGWAMAKEDYEALDNFTST